MKKLLVILVALSLSPGMAFAVDLDKAAEGVARSAFGLGGQKCSACSRVYVERAATERFKAILLDKTRELKVGDPLARDTFMGPLISEQACRDGGRAPDP